MNPVACIGRQWERMGRIGEDSHAWKDVECKQARAAAIRIANGSLYDGIRPLYRHTRVAPHQSVMGAHSPPKRHGWIGPKKRHRSARSLATLEKRHAQGQSTYLNGFNAGYDIMSGIGSRPCSRLPIPLIMSELASNNKCLN